MKTKWKTLKPWQKKDFLRWTICAALIAIAYVSFVTIIMTSDKQEAQHSFDAVFQADSAETQQLTDQFSQNAEQVLSGTYVETIKEVNIKDNSFRVVFSIWFKWNENSKQDLDFTPADAFRVYNGSINKKEMLNNYTENGYHYQEMRLDATVSRRYDTVRFPLGSHMLTFYIEPKYTIDQVLITPDTENSGMNKNLNISGYSLLRHGVGGHTVQYTTCMGNPQFIQPQLNSELVTTMEVNRDSWGLYMKCFIALIGTMTWVLLMLYICASHRVNPINTIPSALFGTVSNIMVGANLLTDVPELGLVEYVNIYGIMILLAGAVSIIHMNSIRDIREADGEAKQQNTAYASYLGRALFFLILILCIAGHLLIPISAYMWRS